MTTFCRSYSYGAWQRLCVGTSVVKSGLSAFKLKFYNLNDQAQQCKIMQHDRRITNALSQIRYKLFVMSGKGGVGKSSVVVNLAVALATMGYQVGLMDLDIRSSSVFNILGFKGGMETNLGQSIAPERYDNHLAVVSIGSLTKDQDRAVLWRGPMKHSAIRQFIVDLDWGPLDYLVVDSPPGISDEHMTVLKTMLNALCFIVTTPQEISFADVRKVINFLQYAQANVLGIVENMSGLICPYCHEEISLFAKGSGMKFAGRYGLDFLGAVPLDPAMVASGELGIPVVRLPEDGPAKIALISLAQAVVQACEGSLEGASSVHI